MKMRTMRFYKIVCLGIISLLFATYGVTAQSANPLTLHLSPGAVIPLGPEMDDGSAVFTIGAGAALSGEYSFAFAPWLYAQGVLDYSLLPTAAGTNLSLVSLGGGAGVRISPFPIAAVRISAAGGYGAAIYQGTDKTSFGGLPFGSVGLSMSFSLSPSLSIGIGGRFDYHVISYGVGAFLNVAFSLGAGGRARIEFPSVRFDPVFPVFYQHYDTNPLGSLILRNGENGEIKDVTVSLFVEEYMTGPKVSAVVPSMKKGEEVEVPILALFKDQILSNTSDTKVQASIFVEYSFLDEVVQAEYTDTLEVYHRNAMTWDDDRKAASFVTAQDPKVLRVSKQVASEVRDLGSSSVDLKLRESMGMFEAMKSFGIKYVIDPASSYIELSKNQFSLDYLQFPAQTLSYRSGDCDDLSICYSALLESVGIETAFIPVPGHIFMAFAIDVAPETMIKTFLRPDDFIVRDGKVWLPVETTAVQEGFLEAWKLGAKQWRENEAAGTAGFIPVRSAWNIYESAGAQDDDFVVAAADIEEVLSLYESEFVRFVDREVFERTQSLKTQAESSNNPGRIVNKVGVLYARYGLYDKAALEFRAAAQEGYVPSMANLGNIFYIQDNILMAVEYFERAREREPDSVPVLAGLAKAYHELEEIERVQELYDLITKLSPDTAESLAYLDARSVTGSRASDTSERKYSTIVWDEEEE
jgi:tetratricopeptide (TPR) repeat protein